MGDAYGRNAGGTKRYVLLDFLHVDCSLDFKIYFFKISDIDFYYTVQTTYIPCTRYSWTDFLFFYELFFNKITGQYTDLSGLNKCL